MNEIWYSKEWEVAILAERILVGNLATLLVMRRASSSVITLATCGVALDVGKRLTSRVHDLEAAL